MPWGPPVGEGVAAEEEEVWNTLLSLFTPRLDLGLAEEDGWIKMAKRENYFLLTATSLIPLRIIVNDMEVVTNANDLRRS